MNARKYRTTLYNGCTISVGIEGNTYGNIHCFQDFEQPPGVGPKYPKYVYQDAQDIINYMRATPEERITYGFKKP